MDDIEVSVKFAKSYPVAGANFNTLIPYLRTELFDWIKQNNKFIIDPDEYMNNVDKHEKEPVFETDELPREKRLELFDYFQKVEKEIRSKRLARVFRKIYPLNYFIAYLLNTDFALNRIRNSIGVRKILEKVRMKLIYGK